MAERVVVLTALLLVGCFEQAGTSTGNPSDGRGSGSPTDIIVFLVDGEKVMCTEGFGSGPDHDGTACEEVWNVCNDGRTYAVHCQDEGDTHACTCAIDGVEIESFSAPEYCTESRKQLFVGCTMVSPDGNGEPPPLEGPACSPPEIEAGECPDAGPSPVMPF
jgi:hypothetical protein